MRSDADWTTERAGLGKKRSLWHLAMIVSACASPAAAPIISVLPLSRSLGLDAANLE
jgi:hypothetical protein